jgi:hypothetical protein
VIAQKRNEAAEAAPSAAALDSPGSSVQEARGMRHGSPSVSRGGLGVPGQRPASPPTPARPGVRKGNAMDALQIFGAMAGGN